MKYPDDYNVVFIRLPGNVLSVMRQDCNGYPTIYINDQLCIEAKRVALRHELAHYAADDLYNAVTIYDAEKRAVSRSRLNHMPRAYRPMTETEDVLRLVAGDALARHVWGGNGYEWEPVDMPDPMYEVIK